MEFSWTTFFLEIINFLVLIWLLKRFFYQPVLSVIEKRRQSIDQSLEDAEKIRNEAQQLQDQYKNRLSDWEGEKKRLLDELQTEINQKREKLLSDLDKELQDNREKSEFLIEQKSEQLRNVITMQALENGANFTRQLLQDISGPEQTLKLVHRVYTDLDQLAGEELKKLQSVWQELSGPVRVSSAHALPQEIQQELQKVFSQKLGMRDIGWEFDIDPELIGGIRLQVGPLILRASIQDEFEFFRDILHEHI